MNKIFSYIKKGFLYLWQSRGFSLPRILLTFLYIYLLVWVTPIFSDSRGHYLTQTWTLAVFIGSLALLVRSLRRLFDRKTRERIARTWHRIAEKLEKRVERVRRRISRALGLDKFRHWGQDERDFLFNERKRKSRRRKLVNPAYWSEQEDNSARVRFIFTDYMIAKIRAGFNMKPDRTPQDLDKELSSTDGEHLLFESYENARYSGGREKIPDETVEILSEMQYGKKKK